MSESKELKPLMLIDVKDGAHDFLTFGQIERVPRDHSGWQSIRYQGKRYQLFGGIRTNLFIDTNNPIKGKK